MRETLKKVRQLAFCATGKTLWSVAVLLLVVASANAQGIGGKGAIGGKAGFGTGPSSSFNPSLVTSGNCTAGGTSCNVTGISISPGQFAVCGMGSTDTTAVFSCSDADGDVINKTPTSSPYPNTGTAFSVGLVEGTLTHTNASETFTCTRTTSTFELACIVAVYNGVPTSGFDVAFAGNSQNSNPAGNNTLTTGTTLTTSSPSELAIAVFIIQNPSSFVFTPAAGWTSRSPIGGATPFIFLDGVLTTTGTQQASVTGNWSGSGSNNSTAAISTIK